MRRWIGSVLALAVVLLAATAHAKRFEKTVPVRVPDTTQELRHRFGPEGAAEVSLSLEPVRGRLLRGPLGRSRLVDLADYSHAGVLVTDSELRLGPRADGPVRIPAGRYSVGLAVSGPEGLPTLSLRSEEGLSLRLVLPRGSRPAERPRTLRAQSLAVDGSPTWPLLIHLPTTSAMLVLLPAPTKDPRPRRQTRVESIHQTLQERALRTGDIQGVQSAEGSRTD